MSEFTSPPSGWYDPPEGHKETCNCSECHGRHIENGELAQNANRPDYPCCKKEIRVLTLMGQWCAAHGDAYLHGRKCNQCLFEAMLGFPFKKAVGE